MMLLAALLMQGAATSNAATASDTGSLAGRLTNTHSIPLEKVRITLRNISTGAEVQTITARGGRYRFRGLTAGEYELAATGAHTTGHLQGILVTPGHESHVQAAIELQPTAEIARTLTGTETMPKWTDLERFHAAVAPLDSQMATFDVTFATKTPEELPLKGRPLISGSAETQKALPNDAFASTIERNLVPQVHFSGAIRAESTEIALEIAPILPQNLSIAELSIGALDLASFASKNGVGDSDRVTRSTPKQTSHSLDQEQLQALPLRNRDWQNFFNESSASAPDNEEAGERPGTQPELSVDGVPIRSGFAGGNAARRDRSSRSVPLGSTDTAIAAVVEDQAFSGSASMPGNRIRLESQRGTQRLHGQAFGFDRQNLWDARNPFTQWVKETAPATMGGMPAFVAKPYSPGDRELLWGAGAGGALHKAHLLWFGALDGIHRSYPAVAAAKHPENFFARPSNDQMQLLSAQMGLSSADPVSAGLNAYSKLLETLAGLMGPAPRSSNQLSAFGRLDWDVKERNRFTVDATFANLNSPGGGFTRASESFGTHSFGLTRAQQQRTLGRWEAFITPNLLATTQASFGHQAESTLAQAPSDFERSLNINAWGQLPQIIVDSRDGFTIGNPSSFGHGTYPDERLYLAQEQLSWVRGKLMIKAGAEIGHERDATTRLRNQTGTYHYSSVEDFASDALAFSAFGLSGQLDPMHQHNCDQRGRPWRDSTGVLHGLGYLPCYSYYSQTMGPSNWWLSTNDWAGYVTSQLEPKKNTAFTLALRWEMQQLPPAIAMLQNHDLPLTQKLPRLGSQWAPRAAFAWGTGESHRPVLRFGYGMYFARTRNSVVEIALTETGSSKGDLNFFMRPTDNLGAGGAPPFPYVFAGEPATAVKPAAVEFAPNFRNGEIHQAEAAIEETLPSHIRVEGSAVASLARRLPITFDANIDSATNPGTITYIVDDGNGSGPIKSSQITVPFFASWPSSRSHTGIAGRLNPNYQQVSEIFSRANSTYEAAVLRIARNSRTLMLRARYTYGHGMDWNPDETSQLGPGTLDPLDFRQEYGTSGLDVRHSLTTAVIARSRWKLRNAAGQIANGWQLGGIGYFHSGLPFSMRTAGTLAKEFDVSGTAIVGLGTGMNGYGGDNRVYGVGRNTYRYPATWKADLRLSKRFELGEMRQLELMAESFNLFNHQNVTQVETTGYTIASGTANGGLPRLTYLTGLKTGQVEFGKPLNINGSDQLRERQIQVGARVRF